MARLARMIVPGHPHHVTQRGNGRQRTFFEDGDYRLYRDLLGEHCQASGVAVWAWVLMPNQVHLILVPGDEDAVRRALAPLHRRYAGHIHARLRRTGHFWQGRFGCAAMDEQHCAAAIRYVLMNPVRAGLVERAADWPWSSARASFGLESDRVTAVGPVRTLARPCGASGIGGRRGTDDAPEARGVGRPADRERRMARTTGAGKRAEAQPGQARPQAEGIKCTVTVILSP